MTYDALEGVFKRWLLMPDTSLLRVVLASWIANRLEGVPVWLMVVGPPSSGKTEILNALDALPQTYPVDTLSGPQSLLSGVPKKVRTKESTGGLLRKVGDRGTILLKDFSSLLGMQREKRGELFDVLRRVYDGSWEREVASDGGLTINWRGHCGCLAGCTPAIDRYHSVQSSLGERWVYYRLIPPPREEQTRHILAQSGRKAEMQAELSNSVASYVEDLLIAPTSVSKPLGELITRLGNWTAQARSGIHRDKRGEIDEIVHPEQPARLAQTFLQICKGLMLTKDEDAYATVRRLAIDSLPELRKEALLAIAREPRNTANLLRETRIPSRTTAKRTLEDLAALDVIIKSEDGVWSLSPYTEAKVRLTPKNEVASLQTSEKTSG